MDNRPWLIAKGVQFLYGSGHDLWYEMWKVRMVTYLMALDADMWLSILNGEKSEKNEEAQKIIMKGLSKSDVDKVRHCESGKEVLDKLQCLYGGDNHVAQEEVEELCFPRNEEKHG